ncbi:MAG: PAS domain-containing protein [Myxococcales bacterium]|jgi:PAS domain S-box-containing protein
MGKTGVTVDDHQSRRLLELAAPVSPEEIPSLLEAIFGAIGQALVIAANTSGRILFANDAALALFGFDNFEELRVALERASEVLEVKDAAGRLVPVEEWPLVRAVRGEAVNSFQISVLRRETGKSFVGLCSARPVRIAGGRAYAIATIQDVTALKRTEEALRESEERFRTLADNAPDAISRFDRELRHLYENPISLRWTGFSATEAIGRTNGEIGVQPEIAAFWDAHLRRVFETGQPQSMEYECDGPCGRRYFESRLVPEKGPDGEVRSVLAVSRDMTELRDTLEALRASEERERAQAAELQAVLDAVPAAVLITRDREASVIEGNRFWHELLQVEPGTVPGRNGVSFGARLLHYGCEVPDDELPVHQAARRGAQVRDYELEVVFRGGTKLTLLGNTTPLFGARGEPRGAVGAFLNITERRRVEQERERLLGEIERGAERLTRLLEITKALSRALTSEQAARVMLEEGGRVAPTPDAGFAALRGADGWQIVESFDGAGPLGLLRDVVPSGGEAVFAIEQALWLETREQIAAHLPRWADACPALRAAAVLPAAGQGLVAYGFERERRFEEGERDLLSAMVGLFAQAVERTRLYESEARLRAEAEREAKLRERLMAVLGHDLRQPMSLVDLSAKALLRKSDCIDEHARVVVQRVSRAVATMGTLVNTLLDYTRTRSGQSIPVKRKHGDLEPWCRHLVEDLQAAHPNRVLAFESRGDLRGEWDFDRVNQVLSNLVSNAVKYGDPGAPIRILADGSASGEIVLQVHNQGAPIPEERLAQLFEPFVRVDEGRTGTVGGLGLGLFIVREIARAHGGSAEVRSTVEEGTLVSVRLPR